MSARRCWGRIGTRQRGRSGFDPSLAEAASAPERRALSRGAMNNSNVHAKGSG